jgi:hypothetical protein
MQLCLLRRHSAWTSASPGTGQTFRLVRQRILSSRPILALLLVRTLLSRAKVAHCLLRRFLSLVLRSSLDIDNVGTWIRRRKRTMTTGCKSRPIQRIQDNGGNAKADIELLQSTHQPHPLHPPLCYPGSSRTRIGDGRPSDLHHADSISIRAIFLSRGLQWLQKRLGGS